MKSGKDLDNSSAGAKSPAAFLSRFCKWRLVADNYMSRRGRLGGEHSYMAICDTKEEAVSLIKEHILPLYQTALKVLEGICSGDSAQDHLYYWQEG